MKLILLGAPGAGKGTQAEKICEKFSIPQISTGNIIRAAMKQETEAGKKAQTFVNAGQLVPDAVVIEMVNERLKQDDCKNGFILDGFPRTVAQAEALEEMGVPIDAVVDIQVPDEVIQDRLSGRRACLACGATYHLEFHPSKVEGKCDKCGADLVVRKDDQPETIQERLKVYHDQTQPLVDFYRTRGVLKEVDGTKPVEEVTESTLAVVTSLSALEA